MMNKRASDLALNKIVILILILIVLVTLILIFTGTMSKLFPSIGSLINDTVSLTKTIPK